MKIIRDKDYTTDDFIKNNKIITAKSENTRRQMLLRHIRSGKLKATKINQAPQRYIIKGQDFINYLEQVRYGKKAKIKTN